MPNKDDLYVGSTRLCPVLSLRDGRSNWRADESTYRKEPRAGMKPKIVK